MTIQFCRHLPFAKANGEHIHHGNFACLLNNGISLSIQSISVLYIMDLMTGATYFLIIRGWKWMGMDV